MTYTLYKTNNCEACDRVETALSKSNISVKIVNLDFIDDPVAEKIMIVPALFNEGKLLAYGMDILDTLNPNQ